MQANTKRLSPMVLVWLMAMFLTLAMATQAAAAVDEIHKVVIQVSTDDEGTHALAMNNAVNLQQAYGIDNVQVEIVVYGPGLSMLKADGKHAQRVGGLAMQQVSFSACGNTIKNVEKTSGKKVELAKGVNVAADGGVVRILELQKQGYGYIRP